MATARKAKAADEWMSLQAASSALGESRLAVLARAVKGEVVAQHIAGRTVVRRDSVDAINATRTEVTGDVA